MTNTIKVISNKGNEYFIDKEDADLLQYHWTEMKNGFLMTRIKGFTKYLHRIIFERVQDSDRSHCDFINKNHRDCRRKNLRYSAARTPETTSEYRGVSFREGVWNANICIHGEKIYLGGFRTPELAAQAYNEALDKYSLRRKRNPVPKDLNIKQILIPKNNRSGYRGVFFSKRNQKWIAKIIVSCGYIQLGLFDTKELAAQAYNEAVLKCRGPDARINIIPKV